MSLAFATLKNWQQYKIEHLWKEKRYLRNNGTAYKK